MIGGDERPVHPIASQIVNTLMHDCEVRDCTFEHIQIGGTWICQAPYVAPDAADRMAAIRQSCQAFRSAPWGLPDNSADFVGRQSELEAVKSHLSQVFGASVLSHDEHQPETGRQCAIVGHGGFGKTYLAIACAQTLLDQYSFVIYLHGSKSSLVRDIRDLASTLGFSFKENTSIKTVAKSLYWLLDHLPRVLFVIDDVERLNEVVALLPPKNNPHFHCLLTSRRRDIWNRHYPAMSEPIVLGAFQREDAMAYFERAACKTLKAQEESHDKWARLCQQLGYLPLALSQVLAYLNEHCDEGETIESYLAQYDANFAVLGSRAPQSLYKKTLLTTWMATLPKLLSRSKFAVTLFFAMAHLHGECITEEILMAYCQLQDWPSTTRTFLKTQLEHLKRYSLITDLGGKRIQMHQVVQQVILWWLSADNEKQREIAATSYTGESEGEESGSDDSPVMLMAEAQSYSEQLQAIAQHIVEAKAQGCETLPYTIISLLGQALYTCVQRAYAERAETLFWSGEYLHHAESLVMHLYKLPENSDFDTEAIFQLEAVLEYMILAKLGFSEASGVAEYKALIGVILDAAPARYAWFVFQTSILFVSKTSINEFPRAVFLSVCQWLRTLASESAAEEPAEFINFLDDMEAYLDSALAGDAAALDNLHCDMEELAGIVDASIESCDDPGASKYIESLECARKTRFRRAQQDRLSLPGEPGFERHKRVISRMYYLSDQSSGLWAALNAVNTRLQDRSPQVRCQVFQQYLLELCLTWESAAQLYAEISMHIAKELRLRYPHDSLSAQDDWGRQQKIASYESMDTSQRVLFAWQEIFGADFWHRSPASSDGDIPGAEVIGVVLENPSAYRPIVMRGTNSSEQSNMTKGEEYHRTQKQ